MRKAFGIALCCFWAWAVSTRPVHATKPLVLSAETTAQKLLAHLQFVPEQKHAYTIQEVTHPAFASRFRPALQGVSKPPRTSRDRKLGVWLHFVLSVPQMPPKASSWVFDPRFSFAQQQQLFVCPRGAPSQPRTCREVGVFLRGIHSNITIFPLASVGSTKRAEWDVYVRCFGALSLPWLLRSARIWHSQPFRIHRFFHNFLVGLYFGIMVLISIVSFFFFLFQRDLSYLWYTLFQFFVASYLMLSGPVGWGFLHGTWISGGAYEKVSSFFLGGMILWSAVFSRSFLRTKELAPAFDKGFLVLAWGSIVFLVGSMGSSQLQTMPQFLRELPILSHLQSLPRLIRELPILFGLVSPILVIGAGFLCWIRGYRPARYYLAGQSVFALSAFLMVIESQGVQIIEGMGIYWMFLGSGIEGILLSMALIDRFRLLRAEHRALQQAKQTAESSARTQEQRLEVVLASVKGGIWDWQVESNHFYVSPRYLEFLGYRPDSWEFTLESWVMLLHPEDTQEMIEELQQYLHRKDGNTRQYDSEFRVKTGAGWRWVLSQGLVVERDEQGNPQRMVGAFIDITERKQAQERMSLAERMASLGQLMSGIAHEINNPNNFITFNLPLLKKALEALEPALEEYAEENPGWRVTNMPYEAFLEQTYKLIEDMRYGTSRISTIVSELRTFVRSHDKHEMSLEDIEGVVQKVRMLVGKRIEQLVEQFDVSIEPDLPKLYLNAGKIEQVLINLLVNAAQAAEGRPQSRVKLALSSCEQPFPAVKISVEDNGHGIPKELLKKVFDPFFTTKSTDEGTGLGLAISHQIIKTHGGEIFIESEEERGTIVSILLPLSGKWLEAKANPPVENDRQSRSLP